MAEDGEICLNGEDDKLSAIREIKGHRPHFFGLGNNPAEEVIAGEIAGKGLWGSDVTFTFRGGETHSTDSSVQFKAHVPLPGVHMVLNAAAAACVARLLGLTAEEIAAGMEKVVPVDGRNHVIPLSQYTLIDDCYNANPASMEAAIDLLAMADTEKVAILGDMFNLGEDSHRLHGRIGSYAVAAGIEHIICVGEESLYMYREAGRSAEMSEIAVQPSDQAKVRLHYFPDRKKLMDALAADIDNLVPKGSTVLIKASHGMEFKEVLNFLQG